LRKLLDFKWRQEQLGRAGDVSLPDLLELAGDRLSSDLWGGAQPRVRHLEAVMGSPPTEEDDRGPRLGSLAVQAAPQRSRLGRRPTDFGNRRSSISPGW
jgi:hypothetical protein